MNFMAHEGHNADVLKLVDAGMFLAHQPTPTPGLRECGNDTSRSTGHTGRQKAATRCNMRGEERVTVQGPEKEQPDGMSHRGRIMQAISPTKGPMCHIFCSNSRDVPRSFQVFEHVCTSRAQENCTGLGIAVLKYHQGRKYRRLYGRVRCGPLRWLRDPTLKLTLTQYPGPHAAARLDPPLHPRGSVSKRKGKGRCSQGVSRSVGGWAGKDRKTA